MNIPVFREAVTHTNLSSITIAFRALVPFYESSINRITYCLGFYRSFNLVSAAKDFSQVNIYDPPILAYLVHRGMFQAHRWNPLRTFCAGRFAFMRWCHIHAVSPPHRLFIRFILVGGNQLHHPRVIDGSLPPVCRPLPIRGRHFKHMKDFLRRRIDE